ncbi:septal ring lytic transglycosylase RlpA family protein [Variovorax sp. dw_308]|uniref:septal ring lytic transglycosylase RlpA family protein n=1 Tax=Variovorax sp. dw_308 TaxID=2721546 RepID=UPI001C447AA9|nr:septal ring lytic transglycosylase RlpA family protein [Variovorax sp. dw_308]
MSSWRVGCRIAALLAAAFTAGCVVPPAAPGSADTEDGAAPVAGAETPSTSSFSWPRLRPLSRLPATPPGAAPQSAVATVNYDIYNSESVDDGVPGDNAGPREIIERGNASWYGIEFHLKRTANGERFDMSAMTAAHKTLPFGTKVCVRSLVNGKEVLVRINDRGPYAAGRIIDLSRAAAEQIGMMGLGIKQVSLSVIDRKEQRCGGATGDADGFEPTAYTPAAPTKRKAPEGASKAVNPRQRR